MDTRLPLLSTTMSASSQHEGLCLRYPEALGPQINVSYEAAVSMLMRAIQLAQHTPFVWGYIDKPQGERAHCTLNFEHLHDLLYVHSEGHIYLIFMTQQLPFPPDGIRYQDQEQKIIMPAGPGRVRCDLHLFDPNVVLNKAMLGTGSYGSQVRLHP